MSNSNEPDMQRQVEMWVAVYDVGDAASNLRLDRSSAWRDDPLNVDPPAQVRHTATHCNTLQHTATQLHILRLRCGTLQHTATHCNTLQHNYTSSGSGAAHCNTLQHTATHCNTTTHPPAQARHIYPVSLQSVARTRCNALQHTTAHTSLQHTTISSLQGTAKH